MEFGDDVEITYVMGGLAREFEDPPGLVMSWLEHAAESGMPRGPAHLVGAAPRGRAIRPASPSRPPPSRAPPPAERLLRGLREGFMCHRRKLDGPEALVEEARSAGLDLQRFRIDLESHAILEAFGSDLEETRTITDAARQAGLATEGSHGSSVERLAFPALRFGDDRWVGGDHPYEDWRAAAVAAGAERGRRPAPRRARGAPALRDDGDRRARGGLRPARPARRGGGLAARQRVARQARAGAHGRALGAMTRA